MSEPQEAAEPDALVAGTLCLMSCPSSGEAPVFVRRIVANLEKLAAHPCVTPEMRTVCRRLADQWERRLSEGSGGHGQAPLH
jgi:hypothetical protein